MIIHNCEQRSPEWYALRCGKITASNAHRLLTPAKAKTYMLELIAEQVTGVSTFGGVSEAMQWGIDQEPFAMEWYQEKTGFDVEVVGFVESEKLLIGCSPDLVVGAEGMAQIKCPTPKNHLDYFINGEDKEIYAQMQFEMLVYGAKWNDFVTFDPRWPDSMKGKIKRIMRDEIFVAELETKAREMLENVNLFMFENGLTRREMPSLEISVPSSAMVLDGLGSYLSV